MRIVDNWEDRPDLFDGYVCQDGSKCYVQLSRRAWDGDGFDKCLRSFPTREIATYELARAMSYAGEFPNAWFEGDRGHTEDIGDAVREFHDEGGTEVKPLPGAFFSEGDSIYFLRRGNPYPQPSTKGWAAYVVRDYGDLGLTYVLSGDDTVHYSPARGGIEPRKEEPDVQL